MPASFQREASNGTDRALQKRLISAISAHRADRAQLAQLEPRNPETIAAGPAILAPDPHQLAELEQAAPISTSQKMPRATSDQQPIDTCSQRERLGNGLGTLNPI